MNTTTEYPTLARSTDTPLETWIGADGDTPDVVRQLNKHLADMTDLCDQVRTAREECTETGGDWCDLFDELIETIERHRGLIAEQLDECRHAAHSFAY